MTGSSERALRDISDALLSDLERLSLLEEQKRLMEPDDPRTTEIAREVSEIASRVLTNTVVEERITQSALAATAAGLPDAPALSIEDTPRAMHTILEDWRAAERRVAAAEPGSTEHAAATLETERRRQEYQHRYTQRQRPTTER